MYQWASAFLKQMLSEGEGGGGLLWEPASQLFLNQKPRKIEHGLRAQYVHAGSLGRRLPGPGGSRGPSGWLR